MTLGPLSPLTKLDQGIERQKGREGVVATDGSVARKGARRGSVDGTQTTETSSWRPNQHAMDGNNRRQAERQTLVDRSKNAMHGRRLWEVAERVVPGMKQRWLGEQSRQKLSSQSPTSRAEMVLERHERREVDETAYTSMETTQKKHVQEETPEVEEVVGGRSQGEWREIADSEGVCGLRQ